MSEIRDVLIATLAKLSKAVDAPVAGAAPQNMSVPSVVSICPFIPMPNLVVPLAPLIIISPRVVIGSSKPADGAAHFQPPVAPLSAVKT